MEILKKLVSDESGQSATEYMVLMASVVAVIVGAAYMFQKNFEAGVTGLSNNIKENLEAGFTQ